KEVTKVYVNKTDKILHLTIEKEGDIETIDTTEGHPFYVEGKGWVRAGVLQKGDVLTSETGNAVVVSKQTENLSVPVIIYNLEVADNHTYYVSNKKVLVHNSGESGCSIKTSTDAESGTDSDVPLLETSKYVSGKTDDHHIIPKFRGGSQSYADFIAIRGIDVDQYTITVTSGKQGMHMNSIHGKGEWNPLWMEWIDEHPDATAVDIFQFAGKMMDDFGLSGYTIHPYKKGGN
ncbi:MAG: DUF2380 domain-containing protein, partial [Eubacterium sp.]|nr:DUF2380 domain-containing protein [Eubacterium sp.]